jgi:hypothetical protein
MNWYFYLMLLQQIALILIFLGAVTYVGLMIYRAFQAKSGCATGCGKCGVDFTKIEERIKEKQH